jgi:uridylate kinase
MEPVVLSLGGSVLVRDENDADYVRDIARVLIDVSSERKVYVVTGGGRIARYYIGVARALGAPESYLDEMGIEVTRLNARLLITALGDHACQIPPEDYDAAVHAAGTHSIVVMGGVSPGVTTDAVSARLAERVKSRLLVNATSVDGAYTADPAKDPGARRIPRMTHEELARLVSSCPTGAGPNMVFDPVGAGVVSRSGITLAIVHGRDIGNLRAALMGREFEGTLVD